jgi:tetratricopeptide (TPR) repeat protein
MNTTKTQHLFKGTAIALAVILLQVTITIPAGATTNVQFLILPFTLLDSDQAVRSLASELHLAFQNCLDGETGFSLVGDVENHVSDQTLTNQEIQDQGHQTSAHWVIAGELQGNPENWELFLRLIAPEDGTTRTSSIKGNDRHPSEEYAELWIENHREFLQVTDPNARAEKMKEARHQEALDLFYQARKLTNTDPETLNRKVALLEQAIEKNPEFSSAYQNLGLAYQQLKNFPKAVETYQTAIDLKPDFYQVHYNLGTTYQDMREWGLAAQSYRRATEIKPDYGEAWYNLSMVLVYNKNGERYGEGYDGEGIVEALHNSLKHNPKFLRAYIGLGSHYREIGDFERARESYDEALEKNPRYAEAWLNRAYLYDNFVHDYPEAIECYQKYIELGGQRSPGATNRIKTLEQKMAAQDSLEQPEENPETP